MTKPRQNAQYPSHKVELKGLLIAFALGAWIGTAFMSMIILVLLAGGIIDFP